MHAAVGASGTPQHLVGWRNFGRTGTGVLCVAGLWPANHFFQPQRFPDEPERADGPVAGYGFWQCVVGPGAGGCGPGLFGHWPDVLEGGADLWADTATVAGAAGYALYVILLSQRAGRHTARSLAATQIVWMAVLGSLWMLADSVGTDRLQTLPQRLNAEIFWGLCYLGIVATAGMLFVQAIAQRHVSADKAAVIYAMEPVFAALFAWAWLSEILSARAAVGGAIVVGAVLLSEWGSSKKD